MNVRIVCVGKLKEKYLKDGIDEYLKRLTRFCKTEIVELAEELCLDASPQNILRTKAAEGERIIKSLKGYCIALDLKGNMLTSEQLSAKLSSLKTEGISTVTFVIGGSYGIDKAVLDKCDASICFGNFTYPHQLMRLMLAEQIYRCFMIEEGSAYHK